jgi:uncharacterized protein HemX
MNMEQNTQTQETTPEIISSKKDGKVGPTIGSVIIILIIIAGGFYFLNLQTVEVVEEDNQTQQATTTLEDELDSTEIDDLDEDLAQIEAEIEAAIGE